MSTWDHSPNALGRAISPSLILPPCPRPGAAWTHDSLPRKEAGSYVLPSGVFVLSRFAPSFPTPSCAHRARAVGDPGGP